MLSRAISCLQTPAPQRLRASRPRVLVGYIITMHCFINREMVRLYHQADTLTRKVENAMDLLNNLNTLISIVVGLIAIGGSIFSAVKYLQKKAAFPQRTQTTQLSSSNKSSPHDVEPRLLSKLDWMEVLWNGLEDSLNAKDRTGWMPSLFIGFFGIFILSLAISSSNGNIIAIICLIAFVVLWFSANLLFYTYFVGRRIEKKITEINRRHSQILKNVQPH